MPGKRAPLVERFWAKVEKTSTCWLWRGAVISSSGYGTIGEGRGIHHLAHRLSYRLHHGQIDDRLLVCHNCDVKLCVNPAHLFQGTHLDNTRDMMRKGRQRMGAPYRIYRGEEHPSAKLNMAKARDMRQRYALGGISYKTLGMEYGVCADAAWKVVTGRRYPEPIIADDVYKTKALFERIMATGLLRGDRCSITLPRPGE